MGLLRNRSQARKIRVELAGLSSAHGVSWRTIRGQQKATAVP
jgi:hypothetical protein